MHELSVANVDVLSNQITEVTKNAQSSFIILKFFYLSIFPFFFPLVSLLHFLFFFSYIFCSFLISLQLLLMIFYFSFHFVSSLPLLFLIPQPSFHTPCLEYLLGQIMAKFAQLQLQYHNTTLLVSERNVFKLTFCLSVITNNYQITSTPNSTTL